MREDLPTFDLPITANSGCFEGGHCATAVLLFTKSAVLTLLCDGGGNTKTSCGSELSSASSHSSCSSGEATKNGAPEVAAAGGARSLLELPRLKLLVIRRCEIED